MKICIIGTGYVGLPSGVGFAELGNQVICVDREKSKIDALKAGKITLFEDGLEELFKRNVKAGRIHFTQSMKEGVSSADMVIIAVGTPPHPVTHQADLKYIHAAATELAEFLNGYTLVAVKSTVPVGTGDDVEALIQKKNPNAQFDVISLPEFLREGYAVHDFFNPDRIIIGSNNPKAYEIVKTLYAPLAEKTKFLCVRRRSSEAIKYASNSFLAIKIHFINEMADFCEKAGADVTEVAQGMGLDTRIGKSFLRPGPGYGGSCFPKDTAAMAFMARQNGVNMSLIESTIEGNRNRKERMAHRIMESVNGISNPVVAVLGLSFKNGTDDCRESPAIEILQFLLKELQGRVVAYDPKAEENAKKLLGNTVEYAKDMYSALKGADVLAILTEWNEFSKLDLKRASKLMRGHKIIDCRNMIDPNEAKACGFTWQGIGRKA